MRHHLTTIFDDPGKARQALTRLLDAGFRRTDMGLESVAGARSASTSDTPSPCWRERSAAPSGRVLASLLDRAHRRPGAGAPRLPGAESHVLTLSTDSAEEAEHAVPLVAGFIDEMTVPPLREPMLPAGRWPLASSEEAAMPPGRPRPQGEAAMAAVYFGRDMHENARYRNCSWQEVGADLKVLWEARSPEQAGWHASEQAVHLGWDSTSPEIDGDDYHRSHWRTSHAGRAQHARGASHAGTAAGSAAPASA